MNKKIVCIAGVVLVIFSNLFGCVSQTRINENYESYDDSSTVANSEEESVTDATGETKDTQLVLNNKNADTEAISKIYDELRRINGDSLVTVTDDYGYITFLKGTVSEKKFERMSDYENALEFLKPALTASSDIELVFTTALLDDYNYQYAIFTEKLEGDTVTSNVVKFILKDGYMLGLTSSLVPYYAPKGNVIDDTVAIEIVRDYLDENEADKEYFLAPETEKTFKYQTDPITLQEYCTKVFVVISNNPESNKDGVEAPFLEHYVSLNGEYLGKAPSYVKRGQDDERDYSIFNKWFKRSITHSYQTSYEDANGKVEEVVVPVTEDEGKYYLEDSKRRILCADYYEFAYNKRIQILSSKTNDDWDLDTIIAYHNYIVSYDFYAELGRYGPDGLRAPILLLMDYQKENHEPIDNLCYLGCMENVHIFTATTRANNYNRALDVVGHEYTHAVTTTAIENVIYKNEQGVINEAISDIMGECIEIMHYEKEGIDVNPDTVFAMGQSTGNVIRDLIYPELHGQPRYAGGKYYVPTASVPSVNNDLGGVHINSSLVSEMLPMMYFTSGLSLNDIRRIWETVICILVPRSDFSDLCEIVLMACEMSGLEEATETIQKSIKMTRIDAKEPFEYLSENESQISLLLPPWIDWNRSRLEVRNESGKVSVCWPQRKSNKIVITVEPDKYKIRLLQFDQNGDCNAHWQYGENGWEMNGEDNEYYRDIPIGERISLPAIEYINK
ncbi:M4 family metallopeptidase [Butyrivibrio sp. YAB3001]|uniref:M4 family metallopeptidase n=1 Tax=Butyrivibrio sp. YAB3001 TaxID=1520812 RepID=UPI0008F65F98|nr:M4 family metallopeptidase [Butyrivibrio sp. YAB3001]SFB73207.1 Thermolysin metallopeptidase, catalytic domain [Butyrivibrio sp. YAB3001]